MKNDTNTKAINEVRGTSWRRVSRDPFVDWIFMILIALAMTAILVITGVSSYIDIGIAAALNPEQSLPKARQPIDPSELSRVVQVFEKRASVRPIVSSTDPSL